MSSYYAEETAVIHAPADQIYAIIADYTEGHQAILPRRYFEEMIVQKGGKGEGTAIVVKMNVFGAKVTYNMVVTEPEPGRIIEETDVDVGVSTRFTVEPINQARSKVTIATTAQVKPGVMGQIEKWMNPPIMRRIYREELANLAKLAEDQASIS